MLRGSRSMKLKTVFSSSSSSSAFGILIAALGFEDFIVTLRLLPGFSVSTSTPEFLRGRLCKKLSALYLWPGHPSPDRVGELRRIVHSKIGAFFWMKP